MLVYFDTCTLLRPWDDRSIVRTRLEADAMALLFNMITNRDLEIVNSEALEIELPNGASLDQDLAIDNLFSNSTVRVTIDMVVETLMPRFQSIGMDEMDAMHLSMAIRVRADVLCTVDDRFRKKVMSIIQPPPRILTPVELLKELVP